MIPPQYKNKDRQKTGFTLIELLVVVALIAVLALFLLGVIRGVNERQRHTACINNLKQIATAMGLYSSENNGQWPRNTVSKSPDRFYFSTEIEPYLQGQHKKATATDTLSFRRSIFVCPSDRKQGKSDGVYDEVGYALSYAQNGYLNSDDNYRSAGFRRGAVVLPSQLMTVMDFEGHWIVSTSTMASEPDKDGLTRKDYVSLRHSNRVTAAYADGHVGTVHINEIWGKGGDAQNPFPFFQGRSPTIR